MSCQTVDWVTQYSEDIVKNLQLRHSEVLVIVVVAVCRSGSCSCNSKLHFNSYDRSYDCIEVCLWIMVVCMCLLQIIWLYWAWLLDYALLVFFGSADSGNSWTGLTKFSTSLQSVAEWGWGSVKPNYNFSLSLSSLSVSVFLFLCLCLSVCLSVSLCLSLCLSLSLSLSLSSLSLSLSLSLSHTHTHTQTHVHTHTHTHTHAHICTHTCMKEYFSCMQSEEMFDSAQLIHFSWDIFTETLRRVVPLKPLGQLVYIKLRKEREREYFYSEREVERCRYTCWQTESQSIGWDPELDHVFS